MNHILNDLKGVSRSLQLVLKESIKYQQNTIEKIWDNSSIRVLLKEQTKTCQQKLSSVTQNDIAHVVKETCERASMVGHGIKAYTTSSCSPKKNLEKTSKKPEVAENEAEDSQMIGQSVDITKLPKGISPEDLQVSELHDKDRELIEKLEKEFEKELEAELKRQETKHKKNHDVMAAKVETENAKVETESAKVETKNAKVETKNAKVETENAKVETENAKVETENAKMETENAKVEEEKNTVQPSIKKFVPKKQQLGPEARQRKVPSSRIGRIISFGSLAAGLGVGALAEATRRTLGMSPGSNEKNPTLDQLFLTEANAERIVNTLCKVRGAALKIGQILSIQDNTVISPVLQKAFERVRQSADFMPTWQVHKVLVSELGYDWREKLKNFEEKPFAAASIGQVHHVKLKDGRECAMKIQYPGVAQGIESDINNLVGVMKIWNVFPKGLFIDNLVEVAKKELSWEVDYIREAKCTNQFRALLAPYPDFVVPQVIDELSTDKVFTSTLIEGVPVDQCAELEEEHRERIAKLVMQLCLREVFEFRCMQTDPNWSNFFYDPNSKKLSLLDFGATRSYELEFVKKYIEVIKAAADGDREKVLRISQDMKFLTGYESKSMADAHVNAVMILAEVFSSEKPFDFGQQNTTLRIQKLVPTIVAERLCPPPEEIYSLHRKLSGVFLLCAKYKVKISCRDMFLQVYNKFKETSG